MTIFMIVRHVLSNHFQSLFLCVDASIFGKEKWFPCDAKSIPMTIQKKTLGSTHFDGSVASLRDVAEIELLEAAAHVQSVNDHAIAAVALLHSRLRILMMEIVTCDDRWIARG